MVLIEIKIPMRVFPKPRPRKGKYGNFYTPRDDREDALEGYFWQFIKEHKLKPFTTKLRVDCIFNVKGKLRCDLDNAIKTIYDCGNGILWQDDNQIKECYCFIGEHWDKDNITITIKEIK